MEIQKFISNILDEICLDERIKNGLFDIERSEHLLILKEYATKMVSEEFASELHNMLTNEGNYPERQAYNDDGILVTFPDAESKKAAIERGTHHDNNPTGASNDSESGDPDTEDAPEEESEEESMFADFETPEEVMAAKDAGDITFQEFENLMIKARDDDDTSDEEKHHIYDVLTKMKADQQKAASDGKMTADDFDGSEASSGLEWDSLHPSILFALKQKWEFDKGGNWYDETNRLRGATDRRGQLDPYKSEDKDEMLIWMDDYIKRRGQPKGK
jgi:hypothetical protein